MTKNSKNMRELEEREACREKVVWFLDQTQHLNCITSVKNKMCNNAKEQCVARSVRTLGAGCDLSANTLPC